MQTKVKSFYERWLGKVTKGKLPQVIDDQDEGQVVDKVVEEDKVIEESKSSDVMLTDDIDV